MFGTVARLRVKPGAEALLMAWGEAIMTTGRATASEWGWVGTTIYRSVDDPQNYWMAVLFESEEAYRRNAERPNQDTQYRRLRSCLETDPEWSDGHVVAVATREVSYIAPRAAEQL